MTKPRPVFIADTCIGGLSVIKSMLKFGSTSDAVFLADYEVNPLGLKSDAAITDVVHRWLGLAEQHSDTLVMACNTLSIRYHQLFSSEMPPSGLKHIVSMVDCFAAMVRIEAGRLANRKVLVIGTAFTASQSVYADILSAALPGVRVDTVAATELERSIARLQPWEGRGNSVLTNELRQAIQNADIAVLACTCFPMVMVELQALFPAVIFLDPGTYCSGLLKESVQTQPWKISVKVTGTAVSEACIAEFAESYLDQASITS